MYQLKWMQTIHAAATETTTRYVNPSLGASQYQSYLRCRLVQDWAKPTGAIKDTMQKSSGFIE